MMKNLIIGLGNSDMNVDYSFHNQSPTMPHTLLLVVLQMYIGPFFFWDSAFRIKRTFLKIKIDFFFIHW